MRSTIGGSSPLHAVVIGLCASILISQVSGQCNHAHGDDHAHGHHGHDVGHFEAYDGHGHYEELELERAHSHAPAQTPRGHQHEHHGHVKDDRAHAHDHGHGHDHDDDDDHGHDIHRRKLVHSHERHTEGSRLRQPEELAEERELMEHGFDHEDDHYDSAEHLIHGLTPAGLWLRAMGSSLLVSLASLICLSILPLILEEGGMPSRTVVDSLAAFGVGAMLGDAFLHQLPHAFGGGAHSHDHGGDSHGHDDHSHSHGDHGHSHAATSAAPVAHAHSIEDLSVGISVLCGILLFFIVEKIVRKVEEVSSKGQAVPFAGHGHSHGHAHRHNKEEKESEEVTEEKESEEAEREGEKGEELDGEKAEKDEKVLQKTKGEKGETEAKEEMDGKKATAEVEGANEDKEGEEGKEKVTKGVDGSKDTDGGNGGVESEEGDADGWEGVEGWEDCKEEDSKEDGEGGEGAGEETKGSASTLRNRKRGAKPSPLLQKDEDVLSAENGGDEKAVAAVQNAASEPNAEVAVLASRAVPAGGSLLILGYLNLFSDGVHNFTDGMALGAAFLSHGSVGGWSRLLFMLAHELPQEIGDFGILVRSGFGVGSALAFNFLSALMAMAGTALALVVGGTAGNSSLIEGFTAGGFIYICVAGVMPDMHAQGTSLKTTCLQLASMVVGMAIAVIISCME